ncbi:MAG: hypothetical protein H0U74_11210 [Bradymonadaceae bacterium]|nr:hypothetical protein [Lujinxingiaceae bacterium]
MASKIAVRFKSYSMSVGRRILVLTAIEQIAQKHLDTMIAQKAARAIAQERETWSLVQAWNKNKGKRDGTRPDMVLLDGEADRSMSANFRTASNLVASLPPTNPLNKMGREFIAEYYPEGAGAVTSVRYEDQLTTMEQFLAAWNSATWRERVDKMGMRPFIDQLEALVPRYRATLMAPVRRSVTFDQVRAAELSGEDRLASIVGLVLGYYGEDTRADRDRRVEYLATYDDQQARVGAYYRRRRPAPDVDPDTGIELPTDEDAALPVHVDVDADAPAQA